MNTEFGIEVQQMQGAALVRLQGDITALAEERFDQTVQPWLQEGCTRMVLDFSGVEYINSAGIAVLIALISAMKERQGQLGAFGL